MEIRTWCISSERPQIRRNVGFVSLSSGRLDHIHTGNLCKCAFSPAKSYTQAYASIQAGCAPGRYGIGMPCFDPAVEHLLRQLAEPSREQLGLKLLSLLEKSWGEEYFGAWPGLLCCSEIV